MNRLLKAIIALFAIFSGTVSLTAQSKIDSVAYRAMQIGKVMQQERVFLHFDNNSYYLGETVWFKAYVSFGSNNRPSTLSKVLYVELVAPEGYVVETKKYKLDDKGSCHGEFELNELLLSGYYEIRAYTRYMLNWSKEAVFSRVFPVFDKVNANNWDFRNMLDRKRGFMHNDKWISSQLPEATLDFFPESGHLIEGMESRVAYELREADGLFSEETIKIFKDGELLLESRPQHQGKGIFTITPEHGAEYHAEVFIDTPENGRKKFSFNLPVPEEEGVAIKVTESADSLEIEIKNNFEAGRELGIVILHSGAMGYYRKLAAQPGSCVIAVPKNGLPEGVSRAVVFTDSIPLAERQFFVMHDSPGKDDMSTVKLRVQANGYHPDNLSPAPGEKITVKIGREDGTPFKPGTNLSLSVSDANAGEGTSYSHSLYTYLLLGSELKGYIPDAAQYFDTKTEDRKTKLDLLMLTHGWTSYDWSMLTRNRIESMQPIERGITVKGAFFMKRRDDNLGSKGNTVIVPQKYNLTRLDVATDGKQVMTNTFRTDSIGNFVIELDDFYGTRIASLRPQTAMKQSNNISYQFALDRYYSPGFRLYDYWERHLGKVMSRNMSDSLVRVNPFEYMLSAVEVVGKKKSEINSRPPHSEVRLNYLDEWEYAQDMTYLDQFNTYEDEIYHGVITQARSFNSTYGTETEKMFANVDYDSDEIITITDSARNTSKYIGRMRVGPSTVRMTVDHDYDHILTASDVVASAMKRHNYNWAYWTQLMVVKGEYSPYSVPEPDMDYIRGLPDADKMTNFKEIVIRCDERTRLQFENRDNIWGAWANMLDNKRPVSKFYLGFLSQMYLYPGSGIDGCPEYNMFFNRLMSGKGISNPLNPNYVACLIPYSADDTCGIKPEFAATGSSLRYTSVQGYSQSKQFYSPDYSRMKPQEGDYRRTLLWIPQMEIVNGECIVELYNSGDCNSITVSAEGRNGQVIFSNSPVTITRTHPDAETVVHTPENADGKKESAKPMAPELLAQCAREHEKGVIMYNQRRYRDALTIFAELVQYKYAPSMHYVAMCYLHGRGINKNPQMAVKFYTEAAELGNAMSQYELATLIEEGNIIERNESLAHTLYSKAAAQKEPRALIELAHRYAEGRFVEKSEDTAARLLMEAAELKYPDGLHEYGIYLNSRDRDGIKYIKEAAVLKHEKALLFMLDYEHNAGNFKEAYSYARALSLEGNSYGTKRMADYYMEGKGVGRDKQLAKDLYREAAAAGNEEAAGILKNL